MPIQESYGPQLGRLLYSQRFGREVGLGEIVQVC